nr:WD repeat-containing protein 76-like [Lytechinus pictus]
MIATKTFYKSANMAPVTRTRNPRPKREGGSELEVEAAESTLASKRAKRTSVSLKAEMPDADLSPAVRRSPRVMKKVAEVSLTRTNILKENIKRGKVKVKKEIKEEEEDEEEENADIRPLKEESDVEMSDGEETRPGLSEYEQRRMENISKNAEFFASLDIFKAKENLIALSPQAQKPKTPTRGLKSQRPSHSPIVRRAPSLRLQKKSPEGTALPEGFKEPPLQSYYTQQTRDRERLPSDPIKMDATNVKKEDKTDAGADFVKGLAALAKGKKTSIKADDRDIDKFATQLQKMKTKPQYVAKVVPERIFSVVVHPSVDKTIVAAGDKWGKIGLWDVNSSKGDDGVFLFAPHSRPVNCLRFAPNDPNKLYSVSYDGTVRRGDFANAVFDQVYVADDDEVMWTSYFDFLSETSLLVTSNDRTGNVAVVDTRTSNKSGETVYKAHPRYIKTLSVHPTMPHYFVTCSSDCTAQLWDLRSMKESGSSKSVAVMPHSKSVNSAFFSPINGSKILTTSHDDKISIFNTESAKTGQLKGVQRTLWMSHNNFTGRWLTVFRASWHPRREDAFVVGSMSRPRRIEVFSSKGKPVHFFYDDHLASVCSINAFHPTRDLLAGGNSSGKLHVFMA